MTRLSTWLLHAFALVAALLASFTMGEAGAAPAALPDVAVYGASHTLGLALDEAELRWTSTGGLPAPVEPVAVAGTSLRRRLATGIVVEIDGVTTPTDLVERLRTLAAANPGLSVHPVVYRIGDARSLSSRRVLTREVVFEIAPGSSTAAVVEGLAASDLRAVAGAALAWRVEAADPLTALRLADELRRRPGVVLADVSAAPPSRVERKLARGAKAPRGYDNPDRAQEFFVQKRVPAGATSIPFDKLGAAREHMKRMPVFSTAGDVELPEAGIAAADVRLGAWRSLGPGNIGGRTRALVIHPATPAVMYAGAVAGGVWKTTNGGTSWAPLTDLTANLAVSSLAMNPNDPNVLYAGTGEGFFNIDAVRGEGIFKTTNAGGTWTHLASTRNANFHYVNKLVVSPNNGQRLYAATRTGIMRSLDGGTTWSQVLNQTSANGCTDLVIRTDHATDYLFAACGMSGQAAIYRNTNAGGGATWAIVFTEPGMGRTSLALAPSSQGTIYALAASRVAGTFRDGLHAVYRSTASGESGTWVARVRNTSPTKLNRLLLSNPVIAFSATCFAGGTDRYFNQGWYDNVIAVDPTNPNVVWAGGVDLFRSANGGADWALASHWWLSSADPQYAHADQHVIVFHPGYNGTTNQTMFVGNDGGIFKSTNARSGTTSVDPCANTQGTLGWTDLNNGYVVTQFYHGLPYPNGTTYFGGTQDNGTIRGTDAGGVNGWVEIQGGDGGWVAIDPTNPNVIYAEYIFGAISKSTNGGVTFADAVTGLDDDGFLFIAPFVMDPTQPARLWTGGHQIWRTDNGAGMWNQASVGTCGNGSVSAIAVAPSNSNRVYVGMTDGCIHRTTIGRTANAATPWAFSTPRAGAWVSSIAVPPGNPDVVYATYSTFGGAHVFRSTNGGVSWTSIDGAGATRIPDVPVHSIVIDPVNTARLYVGTDVGVFVSRDSGATWAIEHTGFAHVVTEALAVGNVGTTPHLFAFTHGRGAWRVATADANTRTVTVTKAGSGAGTVTSSPAGISAAARGAARTSRGTRRSH